jgi:hypothetical protein
MPTTIPTPSFSVAPITTRGMSTTMATPTITRRYTTFYISCISISIHCPTHDSYNDGVTYLYIVYV